MNIEVTKKDAAMVTAVLGWVATIFYYHRIIQNLSDKIDWLGAVVWAATGNEGPPPPAPHF